MRDRGRDLTNELASQVAMDEALRQFFEHGPDPLFQARVEVWQTETGHHNLTVQTPKESRKEYVETRTPLPNLALDHWIDKYSRNYFDEKQQQNKREDVRVKTSYWQSSVLPWNTDSTWDVELERTIKGRFNNTIMQYQAKCSAYFDSLYVGTGQPQLISCEGTYRSARADSARKFEFYKYPGGREQVQLYAPDGRHFAIIESQVGRDPVTGASVAVAQFDLPRRKR